MTNPAIAVSLGGQQLVLSSVTVDGTSVTVYSDSGSSSPVTLPVAISTDTTYYLAAAVRGYAICTFKELDGTTLATQGGIVMVNQTLTVAPGPTHEQLIADAARARSGPEFWLNGGLAVCRSNISRLDCVSDTAALADGVMTSVAIPLEAGDIVTSLTFLSGTTAAGTPLHWWFALYSSAATPALLAQTADQTTTAWAADTAKTVALSAAQTITASGVYYAACMVQATTAPTLSGVTLDNAAVAGAVVTGQKVLARTSGTGLTTTAPATIATPTTVATVPLVIAT